MIGPVIWNRKIQAQVVSSLHNQIFKNRDAGGVGLVKILQSVENAGPEALGWHLRQVNRRYACSSD